jgi:hypothetical protein
MKDCLDRFSKGLKPYLHHEGVKSGCPKARAMRFENQIVAIKQVLKVEVEDGSPKAKVCTRTLVSFQSMGPSKCYIMISTTITTLEI